MSLSRRAFLSTLSAAVLAPAAIGRALVHQPVLTPINANLDCYAVALWARQCGWKGNPAWVFHSILVKHGHADQIDLDSVRAAAAVCDEPITVS